MEKKDNLIEFGQIMSDLFKGQKKFLGEVEKLILAKYGEGNNVGVRNSLEDGRNYLRLNYAKDSWIASVNVVDEELQFNIISGKTREAVCLDRFIRNYGIVEAVRVITSLLWTVNDDYVKEDEPHLEKHFNKKNRDYTFNISVTVTGTYTVKAKSESEALDALHLELPEPTNRNEAFETMNRLRQANFSGYTAKIV